MQRAYAPVYSLTHISAYLHANGFNVLFAVLNSQYFPMVILVISAYCAAEYIIHVCATQELV